jgi:ribosomal protein L15E
LTGAHYPARWGCTFVPDQTTREVTIHWSDVRHGEYRIDTGLWRIQRPVLVGKKLSLTYRRAFGVVVL